MPIYEYRCEACGHEMDALQKISAAPLTDCPECGASALKKKISAAAFRLKGSGWYETDFKKDGRKNVVDAGDKAGDKSTGDKSKGDVKKPAKKETTAEKPAAKDTGKASASSKSSTNKAA
ncbi:FmdB family zinc ribbon protein [Thiorhodovibrio frisius]|uniref:Putative regulatory protein, FmdB family n=1 Tax=Thiorhodovibrio frisius TaxID=631362 RepID=H8Z6J5_9GAMM|nr:zinc ribbon domain-containing protein [Thiorhodovibrio frisius]EIC19693.1 putative regulatory protein, FmdB family [Thiorhodovibrio frisius]WPL20339.1 putative regulatory protein, FmdB family [Thiorhodovibrio frisius]